MNKGIKKTGAGFLSKLGIKVSSNEYQNYSVLKMLDRFLKGFFKSLILKSLKSFGKLILSKKLYIINLFKIFFFNFIVF